MREYSAVFERLNLIVHGTAIDYAENLNLNKRNKVHFVIIAFYCSILEQSRAILTLVDAELGNHTHGLLRSQLEAYADLLLSISDSRHFDRIELDHLEARRKLLLLSQKGNPYLHMFAEKIDIRQELSLIGKRINWLKKRGTKSLLLSEKLKAADAENELALLGPLNEYTHGVLKALETRHIRETDGDYELVCFAEPVHDQFDAELQTSYDILIRASSKIHEFFDSDHQEHFLQLIADQSL